MSGILTGAYTKTKMPSNRTSQIRYQRVRVLRGFKCSPLWNRMRLHNRPQSDIFRSASVCIVLMTALLAAEAKSFPVRCRDIATLRTTPRSVGWIDLHCFNSNSSGLIRHKELCLRKRPSVNFGTEVFSLIERRVSYVAQVLKANHPCAIIDGVSNQLFTCLVEQGHRYGSLMSTHTPQKATRGFGANGLNGRTSHTNARTSVVLHPSLEEKCSAVCRVGCDHQSFNSEITTNNGTFGFWIWDINFVRKMHIPNLTYFLDNGVFPSRLWHGRMLQIYFFTQNNDPIPYASPQISLVCKWHCWALVDAQVPFSARLQNLVASSDSPKQGASELRWDSELLANNCIECSRKSVGVQFLGIENFFRNPTCSREIADGQIIEMRAIQNFYFNSSNCLQWEKGSQMLLNMPTTKDQI